MMKLYIVFILILFCKYSYSQNKPLWVGGQSTCTNKNNSITSMVSDASGNIYCVGLFKGVLTIGSYTLTCLSGTTYQDIYVVKYNKYGKVVFLKQIGGTQTETSSTIALSKDGNYFYVSGQTNGTTSFDGHNITTVGLNDIFIAKYAVDGTYQWVHDAVSGVNQQIGGCFTVDNNDNIVIGGELLGVTDFYGGIISLTGGAVRQIFISKFDSNGNTLWAKLLTGANASNVVQYVNADALGYYFTGNFLGTMAFDVKSITSSVSGVDGFIYKTNLSGNGIWVRQVAGVSSDILISSKFNDNLYVLGYTNSVTLTIDSTNSIPSALTYPIIGGYDIVTFAYDSSGTLQYARRYGSSTDERAFYIDANANHVLLGGEYTNPITFGSYTLTNAGYTEDFMVEMDKKGKVMSARAFHVLDASVDMGTNVKVSCVIGKDGTNIYASNFIPASVVIEGVTLTNVINTSSVFLVKYANSYDVIKSNGLCLKSGNKLIRFK